MTQIGQIGAVMRPINVTAEVRVVDHDADNWAVERLIGKKWLNYAYVGTTNMVSRAVEGVVGGLAADKARREAIDEIDPKILAKIAKLPRKPAK